MCLGVERCRRGLEGKDVRGQLVGLFKDVGEGGRGLGDGVRVVGRGEEVPCQGVCQGFEVRSVVSKDRLGPRRLRGFRDGEEEFTVLGWAVGEVRGARVVEAWDVEGEGDRVVV